MIKKVVVIVMGLALGFTAKTNFAQKRGPSTSEERKRAVEIATLLENDPLNKNAKALSGELLRWIIEVPDITFAICTSVLGDAKLEGEYQPNIASQFTFSAAKFVIEHPKQANDEYLENLAGAKGALKAYKNIKKVNPKVRMEPLEQLLMKQKAGQLEDSVKDAMSKCK
ncbi:MAG: hypothetical protein ABJB61_02820 [bacterium]